MRGEKKFSPRIFLSSGRRSEIVPHADLELSRGGRPTLSANGITGVRQLALFGGAEPAPDPRLEQILERLRALDPDHTTPRQALDALADLRRFVEDV